MGVNALKRLPSIGLWNKSNQLPTHGELNTELAADLQRDSRPFLIGSSGGG
jgi:hypothetical protein